MFFGNGPWKNLWWAGMSTRSFSKTGPVFLTNYMVPMSPEWKNRARAYTNIPLSVFFIDISPEKTSGEFKCWCAASHKRCLCFPLARWFLWVPERKNWAKTYNNLCFLVRTPKATSWIIDVQLLANGAHVGACFSLTRRFLWVPEHKNWAITKKGSSYLHENHLGVEAMTKDAEEAVRV